MSDATAFDHEQNRLAQVWTVLGLTSDIPRDNDWMRASLGDRSVFVQRFGDTIRGFENRCAHRHFPLRTKDRGNGVIRCGFHHWQYDKAGRAIGIPRCPELFGMTPRELGATLNPVEIATCGNLIFGRFAGAGASQTLEDFLGDGFAILAATARPDKPPHHIKVAVNANWRLPYHISMDDYHIVAVHPTTFGKSGYLTTGVTYFRFGDHSAYFPGADDDAFAKMARECLDGTYEPHRFRIFHFFPNFSVVLAGGPGCWVTLLMQFRAVAMDRTEVHIWRYAAPYQSRRQSPLYRAYADFIARWSHLFILKLLREDNVINQQQQTIARQIVTPPVIGLQEERIVWFEEAYQRMMALPATAPGPRPAAVVRNSDRVALISDQVAPLRAAQ